MIFFQGLSPELKEINSELATATTDPSLRIGANVWLDEPNVFFETLPSFLEGANYFKMPSKLSTEKEFKIVVYRPSTIYIALGKKNKVSGGHFEARTSALEKNGWTQLTENGIQTGSLSLETIFEKSIKENGRSLISFNLLGTTAQAVIFIVGKVAINC